MTASSSGAVSSVPAGTSEVSFTFTIVSEYAEAEIIDYASILKSLTQASGYFNREFSSYEEVPEYLKDKVVKENKIEDYK